MRFFTSLVFMLFSSSLFAAEFQLADYVLGTAKTAFKAEVLEKQTITLFSAEAQVQTEWTEDKLAAVQLTYYRGADYALLKQKTTQLLQQLTTEFGSVVWVSSEMKPEANQSLEQQLTMLDQVMAKAAETAAGYKQSHLANSTFVLDFQPLPQPDNLRIHLAISYSSLKAEYALDLFFDEKTTAERTASGIVNLEAF